MLTLELYEGDFVRIFDEYNRSENFSVEGRRKLFEYLDQLSDDMGEDIKIDVIAICCDYTESSIDEALKYYDLESLDELFDHFRSISNYDIGHADGDSWYFDFESMGGIKKEVITAYLDKHLDKVEA